MRILLVFLIWANTASALPYGVDPECSVYLERKEIADHEMGIIDHFLVPNEIHPFEARQLYAAVPRGTIVAVGSERVLFDYLLSGRNDSTVVAVDYDPGVIRFHALNNILLKTAAPGDLESYLQLRRSATRERWLKAAQLAFADDRISRAEMQTLLAPENLFFWTNNMENSTWTKFDTKPNSPGDPYYGVNYTHDEAFFVRIQNLALTNRYKAHLIDLRDPSQLRHFVDLLRALGQPVALMDLSNAWMRNYMGKWATAQLLENLNELFLDDSLVMITYGRKAFRPMWYRAYPVHLFRSYIEPQMSLVPGKSWDDAVSTFEFEHAQSITDMFFVTRLLGVAKKTPKAILRDRLYLL